MSTSFSFRTSRNSVVYFESRFDDEVRVASEKAVVERGKVERYLFHEDAVRVWCGYRDMDPAGLQLNREEDVERNQTRGSPDFGGEEIGSGKGVPVTPKKLRPCRPSPAKRCRFDTLLLQEPLHRVRRDLVAEVGHSSLDSSTWPCARPTPRFPTRWADAPFDDEGTSISSR